MKSSQYLPQLNNSLEQSALPLPTRTRPSVQKSKLDATAEYNAFIKWRQHSKLHDSFNTYDSVRNTSTEVLSTALPSITVFATRDALLGMDSVNSWWIFGYELISNELNERGREHR